MNKILDILKEHQQTAINKGYNVFGTFLQGSQNYNLQTKNSDIDTKTLIIPTIDDVVLNKNPISTTHVLEDNSHDDQKDIRVMFKTFYKQNINFLEVLFTKYYIINYHYINEFYELQKMADDIACINQNQLLRCIAGMSKEKLNAMEHPYPSIIDKIEKYHYDPKQLHHIARLNEFISRYYNGESFRNCLVSKQIKFLTDIKNGFIKLDEARVMAVELDNSTNRIRHKMSSEKDVVNYNTIERMNSLLSKIIKKSFRNELKNEK